MDKLCADKKVPLLFSSLCLAKINQLFLFEMGRYPTGFPLRIQNNLKMAL